MLTLFNLFELLVISMKPQKKKIVQKPRVWKWKDEDIARLFTRKMAARNDDANHAADVQKDTVCTKLVCYRLLQPGWLCSSQKRGGVESNPGTTTHN